MMIRFDCEWMNFNDIFDVIYPHDDSIQYTCYGNQMKRSSDISKWNATRAEEHKAGKHYYDHIKINFRGCFMQLYETGEMLVFVEDLSTDIDGHVDVVLGLLHDYHPQIIKLEVLKISFQLRFKEIKSQEAINRAKKLKSIKFNIYDGEFKGYAHDFSSINRLYDTIKDDIEFPNSPYDNYNLQVTI
jgi:hypothetical protein